MIVPYIFVTPNGRIVMSGIIQEEVADRLTRPQGTELVLGKSASPELNYYQDDEVHPIPPQPSTIHKFDYDTKTWVIDEQAAAVQYATDRAAAYPKVGDQLDMLWHAMDDGLTPKIEPFYSTIKSIKDQYPKPE